jgi:hypothetical protein
MHIAKGHLDNPPSTCDGLPQTRPKQHIWSPLPQVPFQGPPKHKAKASIMGHGAAGAHSWPLEYFFRRSSLGPSREVAPPL